MNEFKAWTLIKAGFWLSIGFMLPTLAVYGIGAFVVAGMAPMLMENRYENMGEGFTDDSLIMDIGKKMDLTSNIQILDYSASTRGNQFLVLGKIKNISEESVGGIQLEAELFDGDGNFIYECSEYISKKLQANDIENFQIKCGCNANPVPPYKSVEIRVVSAHGF